MRSHANQRFHVEHADLLHRVGTPPPQHQLNTFVRFAPSMRMFRLIESGCGDFTVIGCQQRDVHQTGRWYTAADRHKLFVRGPIEQATQFERFAIDRDRQVSIDEDQQIIRFQAQGIAVAHFCIPGQIFK